MHSGLWIWALVAATACLADTLTLRNGQVIEGTYMGGTARTITMQFDDGSKTYDVTDISALQFTAPAAPAEAADIEGRADSPVRVIIYEDLQCPDCAMFRRMMDEKILPKYGSQVAFVHRDFPLAKHAYARRAAIAARFFSERGTDLGLAYRRDAMSLQGSMISSNFNFNDRLSAFAKAHGVDPEAAIAALSNPHYAELVDRDYQDGVSRGVSHTPTVFVNGQAFVESFTFEALAKSIDDALAQAR